MKTYNFTLRQLQYIVAVAEMMSFRGAAELCSVVQVCAPSVDEAEDDQQRHDDGNDGFPGDEPGSKRHHV